MHGCGNDYVYLDGFRNVLPSDLSALTRRVSCRHTGIGSDGLIALLPSENADCRMRMFNADGSEGAMCGNGVRCVAKLAWDSGYAAAAPSGSTVRVEVGVGGNLRVLPIEVVISDGAVSAARVAMGRPSFVRQEVPMLGQPGIEVLDEQFAVPRTRHVITATCVSLGNPHCVTFLDEPPTDEFVHTIGPKVETLRVFPERVNVGFAHILSPTEITLRVWERGSGETRACGTGATACAVAAIRTERIAGPEATVHLPGGDLVISWDRRTPSRPGADDVAFMTGEAVKVFEGELPL
jgi:diaminopimelate epimerase